MRILKKGVRASVGEGLSWLAMKKKKEHLNKVKLKEMIGF